MDETDLDDCEMVSDEDYYNDPDPDVTHTDNDKDPESFDYKILEVVEVEMLLNTSVEAMCKTINVTPSLAKLLLHNYSWNTQKIEAEFRQNSEQLLINGRIKPSKVAKNINQNNECVVCAQEVDKLYGAECYHRFCEKCWCQYFEVQITSGVSTAIGCMGTDCTVLMPEDFVLSILQCRNQSKLSQQYQELAFRSYVSNHPELLYCPGPNCTAVIQAKAKEAKRVDCRKCKTTFCFKCGIDYHAPADCDTIKKWLIKCADDSETANYISAHTKDCPKCQVCIEKDGGCNHMKCKKCGHDFCWMCLGDWSAHGSEYYECSKYKENPNIANESEHAQAREALKKYLFYFERWANHDNSLRKEKDKMIEIAKQIEEKVKTKDGTWIDWQYLNKAGELLRRCRYTLQYTYPYAYYMSKGARKELFEYQQAQLESAVEALSYDIERAVLDSRGDIENKMDVVEKRRLTLVREFLVT